MDKRDRIRGAMIGCAAGDALGHPVEALSEATIVERYGLRGITDYDLDENGTARITADTQLMLLSANGILFAHTRGALRGIMAPVYQYFDAFYMDWYRLQTEKQPRRARCGWINAYPALSAKRALSPTVVKVAASKKFGSMDEPINDSKGSACLLRAVPIGLSYFRDPARILDLGANTAALTHGHELAWLSSAALALIVSHIIHTELPITEAVNKTLSALYETFPEFPQDRERTVAHYPLCRVACHLSCKRPGCHPRPRQGVGRRRGPGNWHPLRATPRERHRGSDDIRRQPRRRLQQHGGNRGNARRSTNRFQCDPRPVR